MAQHQTASSQQRLLDPLSTKWIENAAGVSRDTVAAWRRNRKPRADQWERFTVAFNAWRDGLPDATKEPPPEWAGAMESRIVSEVQANREVLYGRLADEAAVKALRLAGLLPDEPTDEIRGQPSGSEAPSKGPAL